MKQTQYTWQRQKAEITFLGNFHHRIFFFSPATEGHCQSQSTWSAERMVRSQFHLNGTPPPHDCHVPHSSPDTKHANFSTYQNGQPCQSDACTSPSPVARPDLQPDSPSQHQSHGKSWIEKESNCLSALPVAWYQCTPPHSSLTRSQIKTRRYLGGRNKGKGNSFLWLVSRTKMKI